MLNQTLRRELSCDDSERIMNRKGAQTHRGSPINIEWH